MSDANFKQPVLAKCGVLKEKPLSSFTFRELHRALVEFRDHQLQRVCCDLAGVESVGDWLSYGYCCVDEQLGLQFHILAAFNRDGVSGADDCIVLLPKGKEIVFSYHEAKEKMISLADSFPEVIRRCLSRCRELMEEHEKNHTIMWKDLDRFRDIEFPLDIRITIPVGEESYESIQFRPTMRDCHGHIHGHLLEEPKLNADLHKGDSVEVKLIRNKYGRVVEATQYVPCAWKPTRVGNSVGGVGSEGGIIIFDEEYDYRCRITLEDCTTHFAITCGIYGYMVHTAFCEKEKAHELYEEMKYRLQYICDAFDPEEGVDEEDFLDQIAEFVERY